jgi:hypothetical protein
MEVRLSVLRTGHFYPQKILPVLISVRDGVDLKVIVRSEVFMSMNISITPSGIETATFWFVAQYINHAVPNLFLVYLSICTCFGIHVPIIRRNNCIYALLGTCYSVCMIVWYAYQTVIHTEQFSSTLDCVDPLKRTIKAYSFANVIGKYRFAFQRTVH